MDAEKAERMRQVVEGAIGAESKHRIAQLLAQIGSMSGAERLLLYLKLPAGPQPPPDPLKQPVNPLGSRAEIHQTVQWIRTHLQVDPEISLPKQDVYNEYIAYCGTTKMKPLSTADFGKVMKQVYPCVKPRRLGTRGNSRYCYAGMRKRIKLEAPQLPELSEKQETVEIPALQNDLLIAASQLIREWAEKVFGVKFQNLCDLSRHLVEKHFVENSSPFASIIMSASCESNDISQTSGAKILDCRQKATQRGVIKQLKRKIQPDDSAPKKMKMQEMGESSVESGTDDRPDTSLSDAPVKREIDHHGGSDPSTSHSPQMNCNFRIGEPHYNHHPHHQHQLNEQSNFGGFSPACGSSEYTSPNTVMNLSQATTIRSRNGGNYQEPMIMEAHHKPRYDYGVIQNANIGQQQQQQPVAHSFGGNFNPMGAPNLPMNLVIGNPEEAYASKFYPKSPTRSSYEMPCQKDSLNLSRRDAPAPSVPSPGRLPLPGKKMILEAYNNETLLNSQSLQSSQVVKPPPISPSALPVEPVSHGVYLPKKMRAAESGKLAAARLLAAAAAQANEAAKYPPVPEYRGQETVGKVEPPIYPANNMPNPPPDLAPANVQPATVAKPPKEQKSSSKKSVTNKNIIDSINNNVQVVRKPGQRGRPRKKSLTKAKYTRKQPKVVVQNTCDHSKHPKRSSDSCCSLTEAINVKTGIICAENHSEILNRERVSSICNMDKHALDDYLDESSSQENEEELMKYFQPEPSSVETGPKIASNKIEPAAVCDNARKIVLDLAKIGVGNAEVPNLPVQSKVFLEVNKDEQKHNNLCEIRKMLEEKLNPNSMAASTSRELSSLINPTPNAQLNGTDSAFTCISSSRSNIGADFNPDMASMSKIAEVQPQTARLSIRRSVSFENPDPASSRVPHFDFMPISPGRFSPTNPSKLSPNKKKSASATLGRTTSPISLNSSPSPFVSPRNTPVPRSRTACNHNVNNHHHQVKPIPSRLQMKRLSRLDIGKNNNEILRGILHETGSFIMPSEQQSAMSPSYSSTKTRNFPMSAPPSPNILASYKYKPNFNLPNANPAMQASSVIQMHPSSKFRFQQPSTPDSTNDPIQPLSADALSHEVSGFFSGNQTNLGETNNALRSQSVPLNHQNEGLYYNQDHQIGQAFNFLSYNNTPCSSIPATPVPREFCDFGNLNDTCESISKAGLNPENLDKIYNVLDSSVSTDQAKSNIGHIMDSLEDYVSSSTNIAEQSNGPSNESRYFLSRSVPSTPLPFGKMTMPSFDLDAAARYDPGPSSTTTTKKLLSSKSVPSTPLTTDDRNVFSYSNRDFLINGNSVDHSVAGGAFPADKEEALVLEDKTAPSELVDPIDMNNELATFNEECMDIASELPAFTEQGIASENDLLRDLDMM